MKRRQFIQAAAASLVVSNTFGPLDARAAGATVPEDFFFVDERFAKARRLAARLSTSGLVTPVLGDVTDVWVNGLSKVAAGQSLTIRGITIESFPFCLETLMRDRAKTALEMTRLDRDLHLWTLRTHNHGNRGTST